MKHNELNKCKTILFASPACTFIQHIDDLVRKLTPKFEYRVSGIIFVCTFSTSKYFLLVSFKEGFKAEFVRSG